MERVLMAAVLLFSLNAAAETIPEIKCNSLTGSAVRLPEDLRGRRGVLVIGFTRESQEAVRSWGRRLAADYGGSASVAPYEVAVLAGVPRLLRGMVVRAIRKDVSEAAQARFLTVTDDEASWRTIAGYDRADAAYVVLLDRTGQVLWRTEGTLSDGNYEELRRRLQ